MLTDKRTVSQLHARFDLYTHTHTEGGLFMQDCHTVTGFNTENYSLLLFYCKHFIYKDVISD